MDPCTHPVTELRYRRSNRAIQRQCLTCGSATTKALPHSQFTVEVLATCPEWDNTLADKYWEQRRAESVASAEKRNAQLRLRIDQNNPFEFEFRSLPSFYGGTKFRSRLEARWAAYFDLIGCPWQYEPEGYALPQGNYVPDFLCRAPCEPFFVEVKPDAEQLALVKDKLLSLAMLTGKEVYGVVGPPTIQPQWMAHPRGVTSDEGVTHVIFCQYAFSKWGRVYYNEEIDGLCDDEIFWKQASNMRFENGRAERMA